MGIRTGERREDKVRVIRCRAGDTDAFKGWNLEALAVLRREREREAYFGRKWLQVAFVGTRQQGDCARQIMLNMTGALHAVKSNIKGRCEVCKAVDEASVNSIYIMPCNRSRYCRFRCKGEAPNCPASSIVPGRLTSYESSSSETRYFLQRDELSRKRDSHYRANLDKRQ